MTQEQVLSIIRTVLKIAGGFLVAKGTITDPGLETIIGGVLAITGVVWSAFTHKADPAAPTPVSK